MEPHEWCDRNDLLEWLDAGYRLAQLGCFGLSQLREILVLHPSPRDLAAMPAKAVKPHAYAILKDGRYLVTAEVGGVACVVDYKERYLWFTELREGNPQYTRNYLLDHVLSPERFAELIEPVLWQL